MRAIHFLVALLLVCPACGGSRRPEPEPAPSPPAAPPPAAPASAVEAEPQTVIEDPPDAELVAKASGSPAAVTAAEPAAPAAASEIPRDPEEAALLLGQGQKTQRQRGEAGAPAAVALYEKAIAADPLCAACFWELGWSKQVMSDWDGCLRAWDEVRKLNPDFPELDVHYPVAEMRREKETVLAALPDPGELPAPETKPRPGPQVTFNAVGDVQLGRAWPAHRVKLPPDNASGMFVHINHWLSAEDITFGNLETVLADSGDSAKCGPKSTSCYSFRVPTKFAEAIAQAGFDVMSTANNHSGDFGLPGREATIKALDAVGIAHSGQVGDLASFEANGLKIGLIAFSTGAGVYRVQRIDLAKKLVADLDRGHDLVVVSFHGGAEGADKGHVPHGTEYGYGENRGDLRAFSHAVVDAGADLVLGHGPHRLRGIEIYQQRLIAYSLGNFCTWETFSLKGPLGITAVLRATLAANGVLLKTELLPGIIRKPGLPFPDPKRRAIDIVRDLSRADFGSPVLDKNGVYLRPGDHSS